MNNDTENNTFLYILYSVQYCLVFRPLWLAFWTDTGSYVGDSFGCFLLVIDYFVKEKEIHLIVFEEVLKGNLKMENLENGNSLLCPLRKI